MTEGWRTFCFVVSAILLLVSWVVLQFPKLGLGRFAPVGVLGLFLYVLPFAWDTTELWKQT